MWVWHECQFWDGTNSLAKEGLPLIIKAGQGGGGWNLPSGGGATLMKKKNVKSPPYQMA